MNFYKRFIGDYQRDTGHLSLAEHGAYALMLDVFYATGRPLPADETALFRLLRALDDAEREAVRSVVGQFWLPVEGGIVNARAQAEIEHANQIASRNREVGKLGGRPTGSSKEPKAKAKNNRSGYSEESVRVPDKNPSHSHSHSHSQEPKPEPEPSLPSPSATLGVNPNPKINPLPTTSREVIGPKKTGAEKPEPPTAAAWASYSGAYLDRYGTEPVRNATVNGQLANVVKRLGPDAPHVAAFYVGHNKAVYVSSSHAVSLLTRDCEGLRTEWATNRRVHSRDATEADRLGSTGAMWERIAAKRAAKQGEKDE